MKKYQFGDLRLILGKEGQEKIKGNDLAYYLKKLDEVRNRTLEYFKSVNNDWLNVEKNRIYSNGRS